MAALQRAWLIFWCMCFGAAWAASPSLPLGADERAWVAAHPVLRAALHGVDLPPVQRWTPDGRLDGILADYFALVEQRTGLRIEVVRAPTLTERDEVFRQRRADLLPLMLAGDPVAADALATPGFLRALPVFVTRRDTTDFSPARADLGGLRIALMPGGAFETWLRRRFPQAQYVLVESPEAELQAVAAGRADVRLGLLPTTVHAIESKFFANLVVRAYADGAPSAFMMGVHRDQATLQRVLSLALSSITEAEHAAIQRKWLPVRHFLGLDARNLLLTDAERAWVRERGRIRVAYDRSFAPFSLQQGTTMQGLGPDLLREVARRVGLEIAEERTGTWAETFAAGVDRQVDVLVAAGRNEERRAFFDFVGPWASVPTAIVTRGESGGPLELGDLGEGRLAVQQSHFLLPQLRRTRPGLRLLELPTLEETLAAVRRGEARAAIGNLHVMSELIQRDHPGLLTIAGTVPEGDSELFFAVGRHQPELARVLAKGLESLSEAERSALRQRWLSVQYQPGWRWQEVALTVGPVLAVALLAALWIQRKNRRLQAEVAQRQAAEQQLAQALEREREASGSKSRFIASLGHEIRNPLGAMLASAGLLAQDARSERERRLLGAMLQAGDGLLELLSRTLDFSKAESGMLTMHPEWVEPRAWLRRLCVAFEATAHGKGLALHHTVDGPRDREGHFDPVRLGQVVGNLLSNAIKFSPQGQVVVHLAIDEAAGRLRLAVDDSGPGIRPEDRDKLFLPYSQLDATRGSHPGTGLGLALSRQIVEHAGGRIDVAAAPGGGGRFEVELPVTWRPSGAPEAPPAGLPADWRAHAVVVVDDDDVSRMVVGEQLRQLGLRLQLHAGGDEALAAWQAAPGRVLITDCHMPGTDGFELVRRVRQIEVPPGQRPWIVALTGSDDADAHARMLACGADEVLMKPVTTALWRTRLGTT